MKKSLLAILALGLVALMTITGCKAKSQPAPEEPAAVTTEEAPEEAPAE